jgi:hypothetical protein
MSWDLGYPLRDPGYFYEPQRTRGPPKEVWLRVREGFPSVSKNAAGSSEWYSRCFLLGADRDSLEQITFLDDSERAFFIFFLSALQFSERIFHRHRPPLHKTEIVYEDLAKSRKLETP